MDVAKSVASARPAAIAAQIAEANRTFGKVSLLAAEEWPNHDVSEVKKRNIPKYSSLFCFCFSSLSFAFASLLLFFASLHFLPFSSRSLRFRTELGSGNDDDASVARCGTYQTEWGGQWGVCKRARRVCSLCVSDLVVHHRVEPLGTEPLCERAWGAACEFCASVANGPEPVPVGSTSAAHFSTPANRSTTPLLLTSS